MKQHTHKTNAMRTLDRNRIAYQAHEYVDTDAISGIEVADVLKQNPKQVFKTLVAVGHSGEHYVYLVPVDCELDLKKAAAIVGEKSMSLVKAKELLPLTGYVHGGCSPIGMKKPYRTVIEQTAAGFETIFFSAGKIGYQIELPLRSLDSVLAYKLADLV